MTFRPDLQSCKEGGKKHISGIFKNNKNRGGAFLYNAMIKLLFQTLMFIQSLVKAFKPYRCHKLILVLTIRQYFNDLSTLSNI